MFGGQIAQDLRTRIGIILGLALLPLLVFAIWEAYYDYNRDIEIEAALLEDIARDAVEEVIDSVETTKSVMRILSLSAEPNNCAADINDVLKSFPRLYNIVISSPDGAIYCTGRAIRSYKSIENAYKNVTVTRPFYIDLPDIPEAQSGPEGVIVITYGRYNQSTLERVVLAGFDVSVLSRLKDRSNIPVDTDISILSPSGKILLGSLNADAQQRRDWIFQARNKDILKTEFQNTKDDAREIMILNAENTDLHIVISTPKANLLSSNKLKPLSTLTLPLLAWLFGFVAIWISLDRLLLVHLRTMRRALLGFARGHTNVRIGDLNEAPDRISELGRAFDRMAEMVDKREIQLRESLGEKENLLREIHHRVKNNLQIVISLLNIQERKLDDERGLEAIRESRNRINAISLVHKELYESGDLRFIDMSPFIKQIVTHLRRALLSSVKNIKINVHVNCEPVNSDTATPIALFIVEAMTNSVKHGIGKNGVIDIHILQDDKTTSIIVSDDGSANKGATLKALDKPSRGMGERLMSGFARQLSGTYHAELTSKGYITQLSFPNPKI